MNKERPKFLNRLIHDTAQAHNKGERITPGTMRLCLFVPLRKKAFWYTYRLRGSFKSKQRPLGHTSILHIATQHSPVINALFSVMDITKSRLPPQSRIEVQHHILSDHEEVYESTMYCRRELLEQFVLVLSLTDNGLKIKADLPELLWAQIYMHL